MNSKPIAQAFTERLRRFLDTEKARLSTADFDALCLAVEERLLKFQSELRAIGQGAERAVHIHRLMDSALESAGAFSNSCLPGCAACCHLEVEITQEEALLLSAIIEGLPAFDVTRLQAQIDFLASGKRWSDGSAESRRCVFLGEDRLCSIYESRPMSCRKLFVRTPPQWCGENGGTVDVVGILEAEILVSAVLGLEGLRVGPLPELLMELRNDVQR